MKKFWPVALLIILAFALIAAIRSCWSERKEKVRYQDAYQLAVEKNGEAPLTPVSQRKDPDTNTSSATVAPVQMADMDAYVPKAYADSLKASEGIKASDITRLQRFVIQLQDSIRGLLTQDTVTGHQWASTQDSVVDIRYNITTNTFYPRITVPIDIIDHTKSGTLFRQRQQLSTVVARDHRIDIGNIRHVNRAPAPSRIGVDLTAGYFATPKGLVFGIGVGVGYRIL